MAKQVVITGATSGIGKGLLTRLLASSSPSDRFYVPTRSMERASQLFGSSPQQVIPVPCDLADLQSVARAAKDIAARVPHLDVLVLNAGIMNNQLKTTSGGYEETFLSNHLSQFLLLHELLPLLLKAEAPRVVLVGSELHKSVPPPASEGAPPAKGKAAVSWEPEQALFQLSPACQGKVPGLPTSLPTPFTGGNAYAVSKLYNVWTGRILAQRAGSSLWVASVSPGFVPSTGLARSWGPWGAWAFRNVLWMLPFAVKEEEGVQRVYQVAFGPLPPEAAASSGGYWSKRLPNPGSALSQDLARAQRMWDACMQVLDLTDFLGPPGSLGTETTTPVKGS